MRDIGYLIRAGYGLMPKHSEDSRRLYRKEHRGIECPQLVYCSECDEKTFKECYKCDKIQ